MTEPASRSLLRALFGGSARPVILLLGGSAAVLGLLAGLNYLTAPYWAKTLSGHPALVGYWRGEIAFARGDTRQIVLHLTRYEGRFNVKNDIRGSAKICGPKGQRHYSIGGQALNHHGTRFTIGFESLTHGPGKHPDETNGTWDGKDVLDLSTRLYTETSDEQLDTDDEGPVIRVQLRRSTKAAFGEAC